VSRRREKEVDLKALPPLNPQHYNEDRVMIGHEVVPMDRPAGGVFWCSVCGGHPTDPIHQPGYEP
jgi:hypothetical protein